MPRLQAVGIFLSKRGRITWPNGVGYRNHRRANGFAMRDPPAASSRTPPRRHGIQFGAAISPRLPQALRPGERILASADCLLAVLCALPFLEAVLCDKQL